MERHNVRIRPPAHWQAPLPTGIRPWTTQVRRLGAPTWRRVLRVTIGHGYEPWRVLGIAHTTIPLVDLGQRNKWVPDQHHHDRTWFRDGHFLAAATWTMTLLGWALAALVTASFSRIVKKE